jgi:hypothetical protein
MDWLTKLLAVEVPENTTLEAAELGFRGLFSWWLAGLIVVVFAALALCLYARERGKVGVVRRSLMAVLRTAALAVLLLLLFRPVLLAEFAGQRPRVIVLLIDNSLSMQQQDRRLSDADRLRVAIAHGLTPLETPVTSVANVSADIPKDPQRANLVRAVLTHPQLKLLENLQRHGPLRCFLFGQRSRGVALDALLRSYKADQARTALADAIHEALQRKDGDLPAAIVVMTDGQDNASKFTLEEAAQECARWKVPLHIYGVGSSEAGSLQLREVGVPDTIFYDDAIAVPVRWRAHGFKKGNVEITLRLGGRLVASKEVRVRIGENIRETLTFAPEKSKDEQKTLDLTATIRLKGNDTFKDSLTRQVRVIDSRIRILYIEGSPRFEYKFLQTNLLRDRRVDASFLLVNADPKVLNAGPPFIPAFPETRAQFFESKYNLLIIGDVPADYLGKEHLEWIRDFVKERGGLIVMAGRQHMPASYEGTPLAEVLPIEFRSVKFAADSTERAPQYHPELTEAGKRADMLALADAPAENLKTWEGLPGFYWNYPVTKLRPGATALVVNPRVKMERADKQPMPTMAMQPYGKGQVLFLGTDETWRWRYNTQDKHFSRFWGQIIYQMGLPHLLGDHAQRVQVALEQAQAVLDRPGSIFVRLLDRDFNPRRDPEVDATLEYLDAKSGQERTHKVKLQAVPGRDGEYRALLAHNRPGGFELKVNNPEPESFSFRVELPPRHELEEAGMAEQLLRETAAESGGVFYREEDLHRLAAAVQPQKTGFTRHQEVLLWNPLTLLLFVGLISAEWLLRKFSNLS